MWILRRLRHFKDVRLGLFLLLIPLVITILFSWPYHVEYIAKGDVVSVQELGVHGSVNFTYVYSDVTASPWDWLYAKAVFDDDLEFYPLEDYSYADYISTYENVEYYKQETVSNAVAFASWSTNIPESTLHYRVQDILNHSTQYVGDSFGLMLAIGLVEEWEGKDFSRNGKYTIAGTGTMNDDHTVGSVGAIKHKLLTAEENGVDVFFIPADKDYFLDDTLSNEYEAEQVIKEEHLTMDIVPVETLGQAVSYLENLEWGTR